VFIRVRSLTAKVMLPVLAIVLTVIVVGTYVQWSQRKNETLTRLHDHCRRAERNRRCGAFGAA